MIKEILLNTGELFPETRVNPLVKGLFGEGIVYLEGEQWAAHRKITSQAFNIERIKSGVDWTESMAGGEGEGTSLEFTPTWVVAAVERLLHYVGKAVKLEEIGIKGSDAENICYLHDLADATNLVNIMQKCSGGNAIVVGGGYIGMECAASLVVNKINVSIVFPGPHCMGRLLTPKIASYYEDFYKSKGVNFVKGTSLSSIEFNSEGKVIGANLRDGRQLLADMIVVGIGARPNTDMFTGQLTFENRGIKVNNHLQSSNPSVYAVGDITYFPVEFSGDTRRVEHVDAARRTARHAVSAIMDPNNTSEFDYLPFFYSRVFSLSWRFYGDNVGEVVHFGDFSGSKFGAYWKNNGSLVGCFLEGGSDDDYVKIAKAVRDKASVADLGELWMEGVDQKPPLSPPVRGGGLKKPVYLWCATSAIIVAVFAYWYGSMWV